MIYKCEPCNYTANRQNLYIQHCTTKKHVEKVQELTPPHNPAVSCEILRLESDKTIDNSEANLQIITIENKVTELLNPLQCSYCLKTFVRKDSIPRHLLSCASKLAKDNEEKFNMILKQKELELEVKMQKKEIEMMYKQMEDIKDDKQFQQKVIACNTKNLDGALKVSMNALTFLNKYHTDTPQLENFEDDFKDPYVVYVEEDMDYDGDCYIINDEFIDKDDYIVDKIITLQLNNDVVKFFAMLMIRTYKNEKYPHLQAYWANDTTRNNYSVRQKYGNDVVKWFPDKDGKIIISKVINPMLKFTVAVLRKRLSLLNSQVEEKKNNKDLDGLISLVKKQELITSFIMSVEKDEIQGDIIKKMSSAFYLDVSKQMINVQQRNKSLTNSKVKK
jgi:hypothetical protein